MSPKVEELRYELPAETLEARWEMPGTESTQPSTSFHSHLISFHGLFISLYRDILNHMLILIYFKSYFKYYFILL